MLSTHDDNVHVVWQKNENYVYFVHNWTERSGGEAAISMRCMATQGTEAFFCEKLFLFTLFASMRVCVHARVCVSQLTSCLSLDISHTFDAIYANTRIQMCERTENKHFIALMSVEDGNSNTTWLKGKDSRSWSNVKNRKIGFRQRRTYSLRVVCRHSDTCVTHIRGHTRLTHKHTLMHAPNCAASTTETFCPAGP